MLRALTAEQTRAVERKAVTALGVTLSELMRRAGTAVAEKVGERWPSGTVTVCAGPGNNGGDGWVAARVLLGRGVDVRVLTLRPPEALTGEAAEAAAEAVAAGVEWQVPDDIQRALEHVRPDVVVDALLGTGASLPLRQPLDVWCRAINASGACVMSVDLPTGVDTDSGAASPDAVRADVTVAFTTLKLGLVVYPAAAFAGEVFVADIGIPGELADVGGAPEVWFGEDYAELVRLPAPDAHKNSRGRVLVVAGSGRFPGAAVLATRGAMRMGAGYVTLAVPEPVVSTAQAHLLAAPVLGLPSSRGRTLTSSAADSILRIAGEYDAVVLGPGLTLADGTVAAVRRVIQRLGKPLVVDADALNALVDAEELLERRDADTVMTPHPGELARLLGVKASDVQVDRVSSSAALAGARRAVVLKGAGTIVSTAARQVIVTSGTPALATAGTGDVLSGMIGTLLAQGLDPLRAGALAAYLHGRAGERAATELTPVCVTAEDVPDHIPGAVAALLGGTGSSKEERWQT